MTRAVILVNLGTPDQPETRAVRRYLRQFLSDSRVVEVPRPIWWLVLNLFILPFRPRRVARLYQSIWKEDSPIRLTTLSQARKLAELTDLRVHAAMTYGKPALTDVLDQVVAEGAEEVLVLPLYPQYSGSTTGAVADVLAGWMRGRRELPSVHLVRDYWEEPAWQQAVARSIQRGVELHGKPDRFLFSFHGIPCSYEEKGDRYGERCRASASAIAAVAGLEEGQWDVAFQSRFGPQPWLQPYTDKTLESWAAEQGTGTVHVVCPGFAADCLETLEEIDVENRAVFLSGGGLGFHYIPALNDSPEHIQALAAVCRKVFPR